MENNIMDKGRKFNCLINNTAFFDFLSLELIPQLNKNDTFITIIEKYYKLLIKTDNNILIEILDDASNLNQKNILVSQITIPSKNKIYDFFQLFKNKIAEDRDRSSEFKKNKIESSSKVIQVETIIPTNKQKENILFDIFSFKLCFQVPSKQNIVQKILQEKKKKYQSLLNGLENEEIIEVSRNIDFICNNESIHSYTEESKKIQDWLIHKLPNVINQKKFNLEINNIFFEYLLQEIPEERNTLNILKRQYNSISQINLNLQSEQKRKLSSLLQNNSIDNLIHRNQSITDIINGIINLFEDKNNYRLKYFPLCLNINNTNKLFIQKTKQVFDNNNNMNIEYNYYIQHIYFENIENKINELSTLSIKDLFSWSNLKELIYILMIAFANPFNRFLEYITDKINNPDIKLDILEEKDRLNNRLIFNSLFNKNKNNNSYHSRGIHIINKLQNINNKKLEDKILTIILNNNLIYTKDIDELFGNISKDEYLVEGDLYSINDNDINIKFNNDYSELFEPIKFYIEFNNEKEYMESYKEDNNFNLVTNKYETNSPIIKLDDGFLKIYSKIIDLQKDSNINKQFELMLLSLIYMYFKTRTKSIKDAQLILSSNIKNNDIYIIKMQLENIIYLLNTIDNTNIKFKFNNPLKQNKIKNHLIEYQLKTNNHIDNTLILNINSYETSTILNNDKFSNFKNIIGEISILSQNGKCIDFIENVIFDKMENETLFTNITIFFNKYLQQYAIKKIILIANLEQTSIININHTLKDEKNSDIFDYHFLKKLKILIQNYNENIDFIPLISNKLNIYYYPNTIRTDNNKTLIVLKENSIKNDTSESGNFFPIYRLYNVVKKGDNDKYTNKTELFDYNIKDKHLNSNISNEKYQDLYQYNKYKSDSLDNKKALDSLKNILVYYVSLKEEQNIKKILIHNMQFNINDIKYKINLINYLNEIREVIDKNE